MVRPALSDAPTGASNFGAAGPASMGGWPGPPGGQAQSLPGPPGAFPGPPSSSTQHTFPQRPGMPGPPGYAPRGPPNAAPPGILDPSQGQPRPQGIPTGMPASARNPHMHPGMHSPAGPQQGGNGGMMPPGAAGPFPGLPQGPQMMSMRPPMALPPGAIPPPVPGPTSYMGHGVFPSGAPHGMGMPPGGMLPPGATHPPPLLPPGATAPPPHFGMAPLGRPPAGVGPVAGAQPVGVPQQQQQQQHAAAPAPSASSAKVPNGAAEWAEHSAPDGRKYFYNHLTKQSTWEKPVELLTHLEKTEATLAWKEFTAPDGRKYYHNKDTKESRWTMPDELKRVKEAATPSSTAAAQPAAAQPAAVTAKPTEPEGQQDMNAKVQAVPLHQAAEGTAPTPGPAPAESVKPAAAAPVVDPAKYQYATKAEAKEAFKELLASTNISTDCSWEQVLKQIVNDPRYGALKSLGEKKACFNEFIQQRRKEEEEEKRRRLKQAREDFLALIIQSKELKLTHSYRRAAELFEHEAAWKAVPDREREDLFHEAQKEKDKREKEERRAEKQRKVAAFRELLEGSVKLGAEWRKVSKKLEGEEAYEDLDKDDRLEVFEEYQKELERREREEKEREKEEKKKEERRARDAFKDLLAKHRSLGLITTKTRWRDYSKRVEDEEEFSAVEKNSSGSKAKELFEFFVEDLERECERAKVLIKSLMKDGGVEVTPETTLEDFFDKLKEQELKLRASKKGPGEEAGTAEKEESKLDKMDAEFKAAYFEELSSRVKQRHQEEAERKQRAKDKFSSLLRSLRRLDADTSWERFVSDYDREPEFRALGAEDCRPIFDEYISKLSRKSESRHKGSDNDSSQERTRKRSHRDEGKEEDAKRHKKKSSHKHERSEEEQEARKSRKKKHKDKDKSSKHKDKDKDKDDERDDDKDDEKHKDKDSKNKDKDKDKDSKNKDRDKQEDREKDRDGNSKIKDKDGKDKDGKDKDGHNSPSHNPSEQPMEVDKAPVDGTKDARSMQAAEESCQNN